MFAIYVFQRFSSDTRSLNLSLVGIDIYLFMKK